MILIADSGSTKTDWRLIDENQSIISLKSDGINPFYMDYKTIENILSTQLISNIKQPEQVIEIHFYGAGCSNDQNKESLSQVLTTCFPNATCTIDHDLLGAARAACGNSNGIAAILGTGSNSCLFDGVDIVENHPSLGFLLGDEGSGGFIGKLLAQDYLYAKMPEAVARSFEQRIKRTKKEFLSEIYAQKYPNKYLAQFAKWLYQQKNEEYKNEIIIKAFEAFFNTHIASYPNYKDYTLNCVGSIAYYYKPLLAQVAAKYKVRLGTIIESPIAALTLYHCDID